MKPIILAFTCVGVALSFVPRAPNAFGRSVPSSRSFLTIRMAAGDAADLTSALARLNQQWKIQELSKPRSRWTKLVLKEGEDGEEQSAASESPFAQPSQFPFGTEMPPTEDFVYLLEPPGGVIPSCLIVFVGGAGFGTYPQIAYNEFLLRISDRLNAAIITAPYNVGLDHFGLAKRAGGLARRALIHCEDDPAQLYPTSLPTYFLAHSLGCKLGTVYMAATDQEFEGIGFIGYNNFGFSQTIGMVQQFAEQFRQNMRNNAAFANSATTNQMLDQVFSFAETTLSSLGIDFSPNPRETDRLIEMRYDANRQKKTRLFTFDNDSLQTTDAFVAACIGDGPEVSRLPGTHLTPVYFRFGLDQLDQVPEDAREAAREALGGFQSASFGNEEELEGIVDEVCSWILGKGPSRPSEVPRILGAANEPS